jgi:hypothetical protein
LPRDRIAGVGTIDQPEHLGRDRDRHRLRRLGEPRIGLDQAFALQRLEGSQGLHGGACIAGNTAFNQFGKPASSRYKEEEGHVRLSVLPGRLHFFDPATAEAIAA